MLKPKMVFTALAVWFFFHIVIFWFMNPVGVEAFIDNEKGQLLGRQMGYIGGTCCIIIRMGNQQVQHTVVRLLTST